MKKILIILFILFSLSSFCFAIHNLEITLLSNRNREIIPKNYITTCLELKNTSLDETVYNIKVALPEGWDLLTSPPACVIGANETKPVFFSVYVPLNNTESGKIYEIKVSIIDEKSKAEEIRTFFLKVLPVAKLEIRKFKIPDTAKAGSKVSYIFKIKNLGNGMDCVNFEATSAHGDEAEIDVKYLILRAYEEAPITVTATIPEGASPGTYYRLSFKAKSEKLNKEYFVEKVVKTPITARMIQKESLSRSFPSAVSTRFSKWNQESDVITNVIFNSGGHVSDRYWVRFSGKGSFHPNQENYWGLSNNTIACMLGSAKAVYTVGDTYVNFSKLSYPSISGRGVKAIVEVEDGIDLSVIGVRRVYESISFVGTSLVKNIDEDNNIGISVVKKRECGYFTQDLVTAFSKRKFGKLLVKGEIAGSGDRVAEDKAMLLEAIYNDDRLILASHYTSAGQNFGGRIRNGDDFYITTRYMMHKDLNIWAYKGISNNNKRYREGAPRDISDRLELGVSLLNKYFSSIYLSYNIVHEITEEDEKFVDLNHEFIFTKFDMIKNAIFASISFKFDRKKDFIDNEAFEIFEYSPHLRYMFVKGSEVFGKCAGSSYLLGEGRNGIVFHETGFVINSFKKIEFQIAYSKNETEEDIVEDTDLECRYAPNKDLYFAFEKSISDIEEDFVFWGSYTKRFNIVMPGLQFKGKVKGVVFIDDNNNGVFDYTEKGVKDIAVIFSNRRMKNRRVVTDNNGKYKSRALRAGSYDISIDEDTMPMNVVVDSKFLLQIDVIKGKDITFNIPLRKTAKVSGKVTALLDGEAEKPKQVLKIDLLYNSEIYDEAFTDTEGNYSFYKVPYDYYEIAINSDWLPKRATLTDDSVKEVLAKEGLADIDLSYRQKKRKVRTKFFNTAPIILVPKH